MTNLGAKESFVILNQTGIPLPFISSYLTRSTANMLANDFSIPIGIEARVVHAENVPHNSTRLVVLKETLLNVVRRSMFSVSYITKFPNLNSFDLPDMLQRIETLHDTGKFEMKWIITNPVMLCKVALNKLVMNLSLQMWKVVSVSNWADFSMSYYDALSLAGFQKEYFLHTASKEARKILENLPSFFTELEEMAKLRGSTINLGIEIDHSEHDPYSWLVFVRGIADKNSNNKNLSIGLDLDFVHIHESFVKWGIYGNFDISKWKELFTLIKSQNLDVIDFHIHDGGVGAIHSLEGDLSSHWGEIFGLLHEMRIQPRHLNLELMPQEIVKLWISKKSRVALLNILTIALPRRF